MTQFSLAIWACLGFVAIAGAFGVLYAAAAFMRNHCAVTDLQRRTKELRLEYSRRSQESDPVEAEVVEVFEAPKQAA
ncbi:MAG: hypothetical protein AABZ53_13300 [Planctomycetota bacterium]